ncbi:macro domain-containing protein [Amycolatopsis rifamycinica]|uniref:macro domain-containing protein n=1 Tax=Amycolatopsis rifamycinica TaxID=287986 RepID=UPI001269E126|nr:macro domain-containing protein [Amycolatopsis rifamycinica]
MITRLRSDLKTRRFWLGLFVKIFAGVGFQAVILGLYDVIRPNDISKVGGLVSAIVLILAIGYGVVRSWPRLIRQSYASPATEIRLVVGDLFDRSESLVIGMNDTFDTAVPHVIARSSIQGQFLERVYNNDCAELDQDLQRALAEVSPVGSIDKPGKQKVYQIGTIAAIRSKRKYYYCVAYSSMNARNQAQADIEGLWTSLSNLWNEVRAVGNDDPVAMPIIGGGQSRISQILPAQDSLRFIALSFILASRRTKVCSRLDIVLRDEDVEKIDMLEFQRFLTALNAGR